MHLTRMDHSHFSLPPETTVHFHDQPVAADDPPRVITDLRTDLTYIHYWENMRRQQESQMQQRRLEETLSKDRREKERILEQDRVERENALRRSEERMNRR